MARQSRDPDALRGQLKVHDPFELVRWLALSQPDPRKAVAELVQNSLDAGATHVRITRSKERGVSLLRIWDDGQGVVPELDRVEALKYIATHIGHSRKRQLSPQQRLALMTQGQYGIGLLGFWALGRQLEMRSSLPGQSPHRLILEKDKPAYIIEPMRGALALDDRYTEVVVVDVHAEAAPSLLGRRLADFLALELRGQLLERQVEVLVEDRIARGAAQRVIKVQPPRFLGERVEGLQRLEVPGHAPVRLDIYVQGSDSSTPVAPVALFSGGTLVAESFAHLGTLGLDRAPWTDERLTGMVDFPQFTVAPGSRRGVVPDAAAHAFTQALTSVEHILRIVLEAHERRKTEALDKTIIKDLQRAFRGFYRDRPGYALLAVDKKDGLAPGADEADRPGGGAVEQPPGLQPEQAPPPASDVNAAPASIPPPQLDLLPPGPLSSVTLNPGHVRLGVLARRVVTATPKDDKGRPIAVTVEYRWWCSGPVRVLEPGNTAAVTLEATEVPGEGVVEVEARADGAVVRSSATVEVLDDAGVRGLEGIPQPELVDAPGAGWRSRVVEGRWQVNAGHREYRAVVDRPVLKLRYLALLFGKEVVLRSAQDPRLEAPLEQLVEVVAYADRNLAKGRKGGVSSA